MSNLRLPGSDGVRLFGQHWPVAKPRAVMALVHGFGEHGGRYDHMATHLNDHNIAVITVDLHGHGKTPGPRGVISDYDVFRGDLQTLLDEALRIYPDTPLILYGHSMGGGIVLDHGFDPHPAIRAIIASAPLIQTADRVPAPLLGFAKLMGKIRPKGGMAQKIDGTKISNLPDEQTRYVDDPLTHGRMGFRLAVEMIKTGRNIAARAADWSMPLLLLHSRADQLTDFTASAAFAKSAKSVSFHPFETSQHEMHNDAPRETLYKLMTDFILRHSEPNTT